MIYFQNSMNKRIVLILVVFGIISFFLTTYKKDFAPPCFNPDEAAFSYNAYSLFNTGKDEYGAFLPLRLKSFGDYKLPLYSYLSALPVGLLGLNETSGRALNIVLALFLPLVIYLWAKELFRSERTALTSALAVTLSLGIHIIARQAHEALLASFLTILTMWLYMKAQKKNIPALIGFIVVLLLSLFSYQSSRIFALFLLGYSAFHVVKTRKNKGLLTAIIVIFALFTITDVMYKPERVKNLLFFNNKGFVMQIDELRREGGSRLLNNKVTVGTKTLLANYLQYFSPQFLAIDGDENFRFGLAGMYPLTPLYYIFALIGVYYLYKNKERWRHFLMLLLFITPISASLSWAGISLTRSFFILIPFLLLGSYGINEFLANNAPKKINYVILLFIIMGIEAALQLSAWDFYINHYPKRAAVVRSWQCGNKEMADYVKTNYDRFKTFYITQRNGQPYIMVLFYLQYPPAQYQHEAKLSPPDEYGFGQVTEFDKFKFYFKIPDPGENAVVIGYPDEFKDIPNITEQNVKKIKLGTEEIFWIYESQ